MNLNPETQKDPDFAIRLFRLVSFKLDERLLCHHGLSFAICSLVVDSDLTVSSKFALGRGGHSVGCILFEKCLQVLRDNTTIPQELELEKNGRSVLNGGGPCIGVRCVASIFFAKPLGKLRQQTHLGFHTDILDNCRFIRSFRWGLHHRLHFLDSHDLWRHALHSGLHTGIDLRGLARLRGGIFWLFILVLVLVTAPVSNLFLLFVSFAFLYLSHVVVFISRPLGRNSRIFHRMRLKRIYSPQSINQPANLT
jgi:hypothetical protein